MQNTNFSATNKILLLAEIKKSNNTMSGNPYPINTVIPETATPGIYELDFYTFVVAME